MTRIVQEQRQVKRAWEEYVSEGMNAREDKDNSSWRLGDLAREISVDYGEDSVGKYAYAISVSKKTLMNCRTVASYYEPETREKYRKLSFSHFACLTAKVEKPEAWLRKADTEEWSVETLRKEVGKAYREMKGPKLNDKPPKVYRCLECEQWRLKGVSSFEVCRGHYKIRKGKLVYR